MAKILKFVDPNNATTNIFYLPADRCEMIAVGLTDNDSTILTFRTASQNNVATCSVDITSTNKATENAAIMADYLAAQDEGRPAVYTFKADGSTGPLDTATDFDLVKTLS